ncbi:HET domain protein [Penicillium hordei]|uniref:HET domain protein n=1 Tax=Penicillium hordei TaxID=40994 RepID=A0AAD6H7H3_9EURO|nr:HET domain protein [Penicillium hordei]KAJ5617866.1 HET domain protein [Penicillium hordei]
MKVSYSKLMGGRFKPEGWKKLKNYCDLARENGWEWAWMDTCCIDKTNTSDTQEAINAMFRWYKESMICYAYLEDVDVKDAKSLETSFIRARWFTRGWTLQELIAPTSLLFVDKNWLEIVDKNNGLKQIERATGIQPDKLRKFYECSIRERFSWASQRQTTLVEDRAYSLFGLFGINMPLVYGEGDRAFLRLQQELIRKYDDASLLLWEAHDFNKENLIPQRLGALAPSLSCFKPRSDTQTSWRLPGCNLSTSARGLHLDVDLMLLKTDMIGDCDDPSTRWESSIDFTSLGRRSIVITEGFDLPFQASFLRLNFPPGFELLATCRGQVGYKAPMDNAEPSSEAFLLRIPYVGSQFKCQVAGRRKGEYLITYGSDSSLYHGFDIIRDSQWRFQMRHEASEKFEVLLGTSQYNSDALFLAPGQSPSHQLCLKGSPGTVQVKIRPRPAIGGHYVQISYLDSALKSFEPGFRLKNRLLGEAFSIRPTSPREYDVILEYVPEENRAKKRQRKQ